MASQPEWRDWDDASDHWGAVNLLEIDCAMEEQAQPPPQTSALGQLPAMFFGRLAQVLLFRHMEEQLAQAVNRIERLERIARLYNLLPDREMEAKSSAWDSYRNSLAHQRGGPLSNARSAQLDRMWAVIGDNVAFVPPPHAALAEDGTFVLSWDRDTHHFEIEMYEDDMFSWFYMVDSSVRKGEEGLSVGSISPTMLDCLAETFGQWRK